MQYVVQYVQYNTYEYMYVRSCMFLPGNGALFVSYVITSAFLSTTLDLLNFADLVLLLIAVTWARSSAERILAIQVSACASLRVNLCRTLTNSLPP